MAFLIGVIVFFTIILPAILGGLYILGQSVGVLFETAAGLLPGAQTRSVEPADDEPLTLMDHVWKGKV